REMHQMQRRPDPHDSKRMRQQGAAIPAHRDSPPYSGDANGPRRSKQSGADKIWPDERDVNPPWEQDTGRLPPVHAASAERPDSTWSWDAPAVEQSYPSVNLNDMTGPGRIPAVVQLAPNSSWSKGVRAPAARTGVELDEQPSAQMQAMRVGNLARAT